MQVCRTSTVAGAGIGNVLFPTDFSEESAHAIGYVRGLRDGYGARILAVYVADLFPLSLSSDPSAQEKAAALKAQAGARLRDFMLLNGFERRQFEPVILSGEVFEAVEALAAEREIDLIVVGSRGDLGLRRLFLGSVAEEIFRTATCPVLTVGPGAPAPGKDGDGKFSQLLWATDFTAHSRAAVPFLEYLLSRNPQAQVTLLHVLPHGEHPLEQEMRIPVLEVELKGLIAPDLQSQIKAVIVKPGEPELAIPKAAACVGADLVLLGVRYGGSFLRAATHGYASITNELISNAPCPVLTVRSDQPRPEK